MLEKLVSEFLRKTNDLSSAIFDFCGSPQKVAILGSGNDFNYINVLNIPTDVKTIIFNQNLTNDINKNIWILNPLKRLYKFAKRNRARDTRIIWRRPIKKEQPYIISKYGVMHVFELCNNDIFFDFMKYTKKGFSTGFFSALLLKHCSTAYFCGFDGYGRSKNYNYCSGHRVPRKIHDFQLEYDIFIEIMRQIGSQIYVSKEAKKHIDLPNVSDF